MEGVLYKWTNYISGWQPRWFVLDGGTLSYYDSQEEAWKGCKGSIKISVCEIQVHPSDFTRVDLTIPGEQYFYLRAINAAERQKWLVALGTAKACLTDNRTKREKELQENTEALKTKMSELRLYCDLLLQQVNKIKDSPDVDLPLSTEAGGDMGGLVKSTCSTFLRTLEECMQIASRTFNPDLLTLSPPGSPPIAAVKPQKVRPINQTSPHLGHRKREASSSSQSELTGLPEAGLAATDAGPKADPSPEPPHTPTTGPEDTHTHASEELKSPDVPPTAPQSSDAVVQEEHDSGHTHTQVEGGANKGSTEQPPMEEKEAEQEEDCNQSGEEEEDEEEGVDTFFSTMSHRFSDITLEEDSGIPTQAFLDSCYAIVPVLDKLGPTVFAPVKIDFVGNIKKIQQKLQTAPASMATLQAMVLHELQAEEAQVRNSATEALLWLRRGLRFLWDFLSEVHAGQHNIHGALNNAYGRTLRQYHGWVIRGVFALALRAAPSYGAFASALVMQEGDELKEGFRAAMRRDLGVYLPAMQQQLDILDALYDQHSLESDEVV
ncbi:pleckstrin homology domain-containing family A member 8 isoform X1 [Alosa pseudoharengus]|uniref:pleckstrin homology domain-containing family A member 8 isoform X1 n=2 Tax=Alosa pseudoharengus TaxID=34774 RepID=UPI003F89FE86